MNLNGTIMQTNTPKVITALIICFYNISQAVVYSVVLVISIKHRIEIADWCEA